MKKRMTVMALILAVAVFAGCRQQTQLEQISLEQAKMAALTAAGLSADKVVFTAGELDEKDGKAYYDIRFASSENEYDYDIDALTGLVIASGSVPADNTVPDKSVPTLTDTSGQNEIGSEKAKEIALAHAGVKESEVTFVKSDTDRDDGRMVYEVEFYGKDNMEYDYEIDAYTGKILSFDYDAEYHKAQVSHTPAPKATPKADAKPAGTPKPSEIGEERAKEIAMQHAGVKKSEVTFVKSGVERDDGRLIYDIEFYSKDYREYDYDIDAYTGEILSFDRDAEYYRAESGTAAGKNLTEADAKALVLAQVKGAKESDIREFETDYDDGRLEYEGKIVYNEMEYEFEIDGYSGAIRSWDVESVYDD